MATQYGPDTRRHTRPPLVDSNEPHLRDLLKQLASDGGDLVRNEMALAKLEIRDMARELTADAAKLGMAIALALTGALTLVAAATIGLGDLIDSYFLAALIIGVVLLAIGGILARKGMKGLRDGHGPQEIRHSLQRDREFVRHEMQEFKEQIRS